MGIFDSAFSVLSSTARIVTAPVDVALTLVEAPLKAVAEVTEDLAKDIKSIVE